MELFIEMDETCKKLDQALSTFATRGREFCEAERKYQMEKSKEILRLKSEGYPITIIPQMVKGLPNVAELDFDRNVKEVLWKSNQEAINIKKLELRVLQAQFEREYGDARNE